MNSTPLLLVAAVLLALVVLVAVILRRNRSRTAPAEAPTAAPGKPEVAPTTGAASGAGPAWAPPRYGDSRTMASGPSFTVGISIARLQDQNLLVLWNGVNEGSVPVAVHWGSPRVQSAGGNALVLRYATDASEGAAFAPPELRPLQPGEIVSRSANITLPPFDEAAGSLRVAVAVEYGPEEGEKVASESAQAYAAWQLTAVSAPRLVLMR